jgi:hypothetical protein
LLGAAEQLTFVFSFLAFQNTRISQAEFQRRSAIKSALKSALNLAADLPEHEPSLSRVQFKKALLKNSSRLA